MVDLSKFTDLEVINGGYVQNSAEDITSTNKLLQNPPKGKVVISKDIIYIRNGFTLTTVTYGIPRLEGLLNGGSQ